MMPSCKKCNINGSVRDFLQCYGACGNYFHSHCIEWNFESKYLKTFRECTVAKFVCLECQEVLDKIDQMEFKFTEAIATLTSQNAKLELLFNDAVKTITQSSYDQNSASLAKVNLIDKKLVDLCEKYDNHISEDASLLERNISLETRINEAVTVICRNTKERFAAVMERIDCIDENLHELCVNSANIIKIDEQQSAVIDKPLSVVGNDELTTTDDHQSTTSSIDKQLSQPIASKLESDNSPKVIIKKRRKKKNRSRKSSSSDSPVIAVAPVTQECTTSNSILIGTGDSNMEITAVPTRKWIFVSRIDKAVTDENFKRFMTQKFGVSDGNCFRINSKHGPETNYTSYKISVPESKFGQIMSANIWPRGLLIKEFIPRSRNIFFRNPNTQKLIK